MAASESQEPGQIGWWGSRPRKYLFNGTAASAGRGWSRGFLLLLNRAATVTVVTGPRKLKSAGVRFASVRARKPVEHAVRYRWYRSSPDNPRKDRWLPRV